MPTLLVKCSLLPALGFALNHISESVPSRFKKVAKYMSAYSKKCIDPGKSDAAFKVSIHHDNYHNIFIIGLQENE